MEAVIFEKRNGELYSIKLPSGTVNSDSGRSFLCFFIVEHPHSPGFIREQALRLLATPCRNYDFYGAYSQDWENGFDDADILLHPEEEDLDIALTGRWEEFDGFVDALGLALSLGDAVLFYDDDRLHQQVVEHMKTQMRKEGEGTMQTYTIYAKDDQEKFYELCGLFEKLYPHFEKKLLLVDDPDGDLFQAYSHRDRKAVICLERTWIGEIELSANFTPEEFLDALHLRKTALQERLSKANWEASFLHDILDRGRAYFEAGKVRRIAHCDNIYIASVSGTKEYEVEILMGKAGIEKMTCTCPYAWEYRCKHMAAVLFALESGDVPVAEIPPAKQPPTVSHVPMEIPWQEAIARLPEEAVRKELQKLAVRDERLKLRLAVLHAGKLPEHQLQNWKADLQALARKNTDRIGRIRDTDEFADGLRSFLLARLLLLFEVGAVMDAFNLLWIVLETALERPVDGQSEQLQALFLDCGRALGRVFSIATENQRARMLQWYQEHRHEDWPGGVANMDRIFVVAQLGELPLIAKRVMRFIEGVPCYLEGYEWVPFPKQHFSYCDVIEETKAYKEAKPVIEEMIRKNMGRRYKMRGACYEIWHQRKELLEELYGIEWFSPAELNRNTRFD